MNTQTGPTLMRDHGERESRANDRPAQPVSLASYFRDERDRPPRYLGQLNPEFQAALAAHHDTVKPADCDFYHTIQAPDGELHAGAWDLRGHEAAYLGHHPLDGRAVLEFGPASGWLSAHIASQAASLTVFDLPMGSPPQLVPHPDIDETEQARFSAASAGRLRNSWWYAKRRIGFEARAVYADVYDPPPDLGRFDMSFFGAILLHLCNPFQALRSAAAITDEAIVVTDVFSAPSLSHLEALQRLLPTLAVFNPSPPPAGLTHWWALSPDVIQHMLRLLGFPDQTVTQHSPPRMSNQPPLFTVVGRRPGRSAVAMPKAEPAIADTLPPLASEVAALPVPPPELRFLVSGTEDEATFLDLGRLGFHALGSSLRRSGADPGSVGRVLDFGCGVGRVLRHWKQFPSLDIHGTDLSADMVAWDQANLSFATFSTNGVEPRLNYPANSFGLIYALSVFTHLPVDIQLTWWAELVRITRPGGLLYFTTHGVRYRALLSAEQQAAFDAGEMVVTGSQLPGSNHCAAFHPKICVEREFAGGFGLQLLEHMPRGALGNPEQDSYLVRKPA